MIKDYPNMRKLRIFQNDITKQQLELILKGFQNLETLCVAGGASNLKMLDLDVIKEYGKSLQFISLYYIDTAKFSKKDLHKLFDNIFDIIVIADGELKMASNAIALEIENETEELIGWLF